MYGGCMRWLAITAMLVAAMPATDVRAQAPAAPSGAAAAVPANALDQLVGRIALYPDDLVAIILPASTNPLQVVQADRFLEKRKADPNLAVNEGWDDSVKALLNYPEVVKSMSADLEWTSALGEAVVADQGAVLEAIQAFRRRTQAAGNLKTDNKQVIVVEKELIRIVPADPQVIYVPQYTPATVVVAGGYAAWGYYPAPYPVYYYPYAAGAAFATGLIWGAAIGAAWSGGRYATHYGSNANININRNTNINTGNINTGNINAGDRNRAATQPAGGSTQWKSGKQPGQVSGTTARPQQGARVGDAQPAAARSASASRPATTQPTRPATTQPTRPATAQATRTGTTQPAAAASSRAGDGISGGAFNGYGSGRQTQMDSARGSASRQSMSGPGGRRSGGGRR